MSEWILYVDDEPDMEDLIQLNFRKQIKEKRFQFAFAANGQEALEKLKNNEELCMVVTDINMPVMDGLALLGELSKLGRPVRTMVVSAYGDLKNIRSAMNKGAFDFVTKPIDFQDFETTLEKTLGEIEYLKNALATQKELEIERVKRLEAQEESLRIMSENARLLAATNESLEAQVQERTREITEKNLQLEEEISKNEALLLNILPFQTAQELKKNGKAQARYHPEVTVLFTDFKNFTRIAEALSPEELVKEIDICYRAFDQIMDMFGLEKIKTIGDSYMAACGLPVAHPDHALSAVKAALEIQNFMKRHKEDREKENKPVFEIRIGLHSGPVVAGIVGSKKFAYDIWGDTVNLASRMENASEVGKINVSGSTYSLVQHAARCQYRGKFMVKNKGEVDMYFVDGLVD